MLKFNKQGKIEKNLDLYEPDMWVTITEALKLLPDLLVKRTWEDWRSKNKDNSDLQLGPQTRTFGQRCIKTKIKWLIRYQNGDPWEELSPQQPQQATIVSITRSKHNS